MIAGLTDVVGGGPRGAAAELPPTVVLASPLTEHAAVLEVWTPLTRGGTLVVARLQAKLDADSFVNSLVEAGATAAYFTAEALERAVELGALGRAAETLRCIWVNESLQAGAAEAVFAALPGAALVLGYGLLEATPFVTAAVLRQGDALVGDPIGHPLMNMRVRPTKPNHPSLFTCTSR